MTTPGRLAWLSLTPDELRLLRAAVAQGLAHQADAAEEQGLTLAKLNERLEKQSRSTFPAVRLTAAEVEALGPGFRAMLDGLRRLRRSGAASLPASTQAVLAEHLPEAAADPEKAALEEQKVKALQVKVGLQKRWVKGLV
ncbi:MAG: hypothetical protein HYY05_02860 [Chloroflexi bacterium]|nr:hypothetical protein [Chloroflexota bacterium]